MKDDLTKVPGVGRITADKLMAGGILSFSDLAGADLERISELSKFPEVRAGAIRKGALEILQSVSGTEAVSEEKATSKEKEKKSNKKSKKKGKKKDKKKSKREKMKAGKKAKKKKK